MDFPDNNYNAETYFKITRYFDYLLVSIILVFIAGFITYGERFRLWEYTYSYIGMLRTPGGNPNIVSFLIFLAGSLFNSFICFRISSFYINKFFRLLFRICGVGFILLMLPCDIINSIHSLGGAMIFGSLWIFSLARINEIYHSGIKNFALIYFLILNLTILPYAYLYFINSAYQQIAQKPAIIGLILTVKFVISEHLNEPIKEDYDRKIA